MLGLSGVRGERFKAMKENDHPDYLEFEKLRNRLAKWLGMHMPKLNDREKALSRWEPMGDYASKRKTVLGDIIIKALPKASEARDAALESLGLVKSHVHCAAFREENDLYSTVGKKRKEAREAAKEEAAKKKKAAEAAKDGPQPAKKAKTSKKTAKSSKSATNKSVQDSGNDETVDDGPAPPPASTSALPTDPETRRLLTESFPNRPALIHTDGTGRLCGLHAIINSMQFQQNHLQTQPSIEELVEIANDLFSADIANFDTTELNAILDVWTSRQPGGLHLVLGYLDNSVPILLGMETHTTAGDIVWISNDNAQQELAEDAGHAVAATMLDNHWSGLRDDIPIDPRLAAVSELQNVDNLEGGKDRNDGDDEDEDMEEVNGS